MTRVPILAALLALSSPLSAQIASSPATTPSGGRKLQVFLAEFDQQGTAPSGVDVAALAKSLVRLQLNGVRGLELRDATTELACAGRITKLEQQNVASVAQQGTAADDAPVAIVALHARVDSQRVVLDASVQRCAGGALTPLQHFDQEIGWRASVSELVSLVGSIARRVEAEIPKRSVAVGRFDAGVSDSNSPRLSLALGAADFVASRIARLTDVRVLPQDKDSAADYRIDGTMSFRRIGDGVDAQVFVTPRGSVRQKEAIVVHGSDQRLADFYTVLGNAVAQRLALLLSRESFGTQVGATAVSDDSLTRLARHALCIESAPGCASAADEAVALLGGLLTRRSDPDLVAMLGQAELARGNPGSASISFKRAIAAADSATYDVGRRTAARGLALRGLIAIARNAGDNAAAIPLYDSLVTLVKADSQTARDRALNLRLARRPIASLRELAVLSERAPGWSQLVADFDTTLTDVSPQDLAEYARSVGEACARRDVLRATCSRVLEQKLAALSQAEPYSERTRRLATTLAQVSNGNPERQIAAYLVIARSHLQPARFVSSVNGPNHLPTDTLETSRAEQAIRSADSLSRATNSATGTRGVAWAMQRLAFARHQYAEAYRVAQRLQTQAPSDDAEERLLTAEAALMYGYQLAQSDQAAESKSAFLVGKTAILPLVRAREPASYLMYRELAHALGQDAEVRATLDTISRARPDDWEAARVLSFSCIEYSKDYACALEAQRRAYTSGRLRSYSDTLDAAETAVVAGDYDTANTWLTPLLVRPAEGCYRGVAFLYAYWLAAARNDSAAQADALRMRADARTSQGPSAAGCWLFAGARARLQQLDPTRMPIEAKTRLLAMMQESEIGR